MTERDTFMSSLSAVAAVAGLFLVFICGVMLSFEIFTAIAVSADILPSIGDYSLGIIILTPTPVAAFRIEGVFAFLYYLFIITSVIVSFILLVYFSYKAFAGNLGKSTDRCRREQDIVDSVKMTPLFAVVTLFAATISFNIIFNTIIVSSGGEPFSPPPSDPVWIDQYLYMNASVWEEVICRMLLIGAPMAVLGLMLREKGSAGRLFGGFGMSREALVFILVSSMIFSYAHLSGWDVFKIVPTFVTGLALGYLFVKFGLYASIMLHFLINYMSSLEWMIGSAGSLLAVLFLIVVAAVGAVFIVRYLKYGVGYLVNTFSNR
jgi:hypothetical protein